MAKIEGMHHACVTVSDMERSKRWYQEVLGAKLVGEFDLDVPQLGVGVGIPGAHLLGAMLQWGEGEGATMVELLHYLDPVGKPFDANTPMNDIGCTHVAFATVNAIDELHRDLVAKGVEFYSPPQSIDLEGETVKFCYFKDPDGVTLELIGT